MRLLHDFYNNKWPIVISGLAIWLFSFGIVMYMTANGQVPEGLTDKEKYYWYQEEINKLLKELGSSDYPLTVPYEDSCYANGKCWFSDLTPEELKEPIKPIGNITDSIVNRINNITSNASD